MNEVFLNTEQAAEMLNLSAYTIRAYARQGIIPAHKVGRTWRFSRTDLDEWVLAQRQPSSPADGLVARDRPASAAPDTLPYAVERRMTATDHVNVRREAIETLLAIRARARKGNVSTLLQESRRELLARGNADSDRK